jgi:uncharacterized HAD superfamily protein
MRIGIDLDEVTVGFMKHLLKFYHKKTGKLFKEKDFISYDLWETLGGTREEAIDLVEEFHNSEDFENIEPIENSFESIRKLVECNEIFIITARPSNWKEKTERWARKHLAEINPRIIYSGDFYEQGKTKAEICEELGINLMIEDNKSYALACAEKGIKVLLFDKPWNQMFEHENVIRVFSWDEAVKKIAQQFL